ncbi:MAG: sigma 54-interacting transcriptional regulator [Myxococcota bacterium]
MTMDAELALYRSLARLDMEDVKAQEFLEQALQLVVKALDARLGLLAVGPSPLTNPIWHATHGAELPALRERVSQTIVKAARPGELLVTDNAMEDPRFDSASLEAKSIEQVMCAAMPNAIVYVQGRESRRMWGAEDRHLMEIAVDRFRPLCDQLRWRARWDQDATLVYREKLELNGIVGRSPALANVLRKVAQYAPLELPVLLTGPSGTGKSKLAEAIHRNSARRDKPFVRLNCATMLGDARQFELFGADAGAYTGMRGPIRGLIRDAEGGTLFLDEVGYLPMNVQPQLLTFLDDGKYRRMPSGDEQAANVRIIAASALDLDNPDVMLPELRNRLRRLPIAIPSLASRLDDIPELATHIVCQLAMEQGTPGLPLTPAAYAWLEQRGWDDGNIRSLEDVLRWALLNAGDARAGAIGVTHFEGVEYDDDLHLGRQTDAFRRRFAAMVLARCGGRYAEAAKTLGIHRSTLYDLLPRVSDSDDSS